MTRFRFIPLAIALTAAGSLIGCSTAPAMPAGTASAHSKATPEPMAGMDAQMKTMQAMHEKMMNAKSPEERSKLMAEQMKAMQDGMKMMEGMASPGMAGMKDMSGGMGAHHAMMEKRMAMMQTMMKMMMDRMAAAPAR